MIRSAAALPFLWMIACQGEKPSGDSETDSPETDLPDTVVDTDTPDPLETDAVETDPAETDVVETDPAETDLAETDPAETDPAETVDTEQPDTDTVDAIDTPDTDTAVPDPVDTPAPVELPPDWGAGFLDLTTDLWATTTRGVGVGDRVAGIEPDLTHGIFVDLDGDDMPEVVLLGTIAPGGTVPTPMVLRFDPGSATLVHDEVLSDVLATIDPQLLVMRDVDADGLVDVVRGRWRDDVVFATGPATWYQPLGQVAQPYDGGLMGGGFVDADGDGLLDLMRSAAGCRPGTSTYNLRYGREPRWWYEPAGVIGVHDAGVAHTMGLVPFGGTSLTLMVGGWCRLNTPAPAFFVPDALTADGWRQWVPTDATPANSIYKTRPVVAGRSLSLTIPMGATVGDVDGDGLFDLIFATIHDDLLIFGDTPALPLIDKTWTVRATLPPRVPEPAWPTGPFDLMKPWGVAAFDLDRDGATDIIHSSGDDYTDFVNDTPGAQRPLVWRNARTGFELVTQPIGLPATLDGRSLTIGDLDRDGRPDVILGGHGELPRVLLNVIPGGRPPIAIRLVGTTSNALGLGARVEVLDEGHADITMMGAVFSPGPQSEPLVFSTTGADGVAATVRVTWPSGLVQEVHDLRAWAVHTIVEPSTLVVDAPLRHVRADGAATIALRVTPRDIDGAARPGVVTFTLLSGTGTLLGAPVADGDSYVQLIQSLTAPGYALIEAAVDGVPIAVRPRLGWDVAGP